MSESRREKRGKKERKKVIFKEIEEDLENSGDLDDSYKGKMSPTYCQNPFSEELVKLQKCLCFY